MKQMVSRFRQQAGLSLLQLLFVIGAAGVAAWLILTYFFTP